MTSLLFRENSSSTFPAMLIEHQVPSQEEQAAHQLHLEHTILSMLPSSITVFNLGGCVRVHTAWRQDQGRPHHQIVRLACRVVLGACRLLARSVVCVGCTYVGRTGRS